MFKAAQPALLYLVPFTLFPLLTMAWLKVLCFKAVKGRELSVRILSPWPGYIVDYGIGLSYVWVAGRYDNPTPESTLFPQSGIYEFGLQHIRMQIFDDDISIYTLRTFLHFINLFLCLRATCELCGPNLSSPPPQPSTKQSKTLFSSAIFVFICPAYLTV